jgi:RNA polymerase sigma factor (sigma-70 family)
MDVVLASLRAKEGLADFYKTYRSEFLSWVTRYGCTRDEAKDAYQTSVLVFYENVVSGRLTVLNSSIKTYLFAIGKNKILEMKRAAGKLSGIEEVEESLPDLVDEDGQADPHQLKRVSVCLEKLGEPCATLLKQFYYHNSSLEEIAQQLNYKTTDSAKNQKYKCLVRLRKLFNEEKLSLG